MAEVRKREIRWGSTARTQKLLELLHKRGISDRSGEWMRQEMFPQDIGDKKDLSVIVRKALACKAMLESMASRKNSKTTRTFEINPGELIVGVIPMGSVGLGKEFPPYLTDEEKRLSSYSSRDVESTFGHNCPDHSRVLERGLKDILDICKAKKIFLQSELDAPLGQNRGWIMKKKDFYTAVEICCEAVVNYAASYASLAEKQSEKEKDQKRKYELLEIARICRKVPLHPAESFHEAVQSMFFVHLALHSFMNLMSIGRMDLILQLYLQGSLKRGEIDEAGAQELIECFLIKCAERLNMTSAYLEKQDHLDFGTGLGTNPIFLDQIASANNFLQNIVIGGINRKRKDVTCPMTYLILKAVSVVGLPTPTINIRLHDESPAKLLMAAGETLCKSRTGLPIVYNDETIIPGMFKAGIPLKEARDYVVDGCWEPILNANGDWTFGMINMLTCMECALNSGRLLTNTPNLLGGKKMGYASLPPENIRTFDELLEQLKFHIGFFTDKVALQLYSFYSIDASVTPTPFFSSIFSNCLEKGIDKTWGGADYNLGGVIASAMPNAANALAALKQWVFEKRKYTLPQVVRALKESYTNDQKMFDDFRSSPKFGNNDPYVDKIMGWLLETFHAAVKQAARLANMVFLDKPRTAEDRLRIKSLRAIAGYEGKSMKRKFGKKFKLLFTSGSGTFGQYSFTGIGVNASADARHVNAPLAPNCSPIPGTMEGGIGHLLTSTRELNTGRFGAGLVYDVCLDSALDKPEKVAAVLADFVKYRGNIMTVSIADHKMLQEIYDLSEEVRNMKSSPEVLVPYAQLSVRVGGWNAPFVTFSREQQQNYLDRGLNK